MLFKIWKIVDWDGKNQIKQTYSKYCNYNLPDLKMQFGIFFIVIHEHLIKFETFLHGFLVGRVAFIYEYFLK